MYFDIVTVTAVSEAFGILHKREDAAGRPHSPISGHGKAGIGVPTSTSSDGDRLRTHHTASTGPAKDYPTGSSRPTGSVPPSDVTTAATDLITFLKLSQQTYQGTQQGGTIPNGETHPLRSMRTPHDKQYSTIRGAPLERDSSSRSYQFVRPTKEISKSSSLLQPTRSSQHKTSSTSPLRNSSQEAGERKEGHFAEARGRRRGPADGRRPVGVRSASPRMTRSQVSSHLVHMGQVDPFLLLHPLVPFVRVIRVLST